MENKYTLEEIVKVLVSIPQAVGTIAIDIFKDLTTLLILRFQYRKR